MNRILGIVIVIALLVIGFIAYSRPEFVPGNLDVTGVIYLILVLMLWTGAAYGFPEIRQNWRQALVGALFWGGVIVAIMFAYQMLS
ncbi:MAG: hypothetical protein R3C16_02365 [Hyphomonadaceae bacterium]